MKGICASVVGLCLVLAGCGGSGGGSNNGASWDGLGDSYPSADPGTSIVINHEEAYAKASLIPDAALADGRQLQVVFGHQSVGGNILSGLGDLQSKSSRYAANTVDYPDSNPSGCISQFGVGSNGDPQSKIDDFVAKVNSGSMASANVAFFKFCYVDFDGGTDAAAVFNAYKSAMENLETAHPGIKFVWWTAPIQTDYLESRHQFNELVRSYCTANNKVLFDIAAIESHKPDGTETNASQPTLYSGYTSDGGHLNDAGALRVARAWHWLMARIAGWNGQG